jgi:hypothetical protein
MCTTKPGGFDFVITVYSLLLPIYAGFYRRLSLYRNHKLTSPAWRRWNSPLRQLAISKSRPTSSILRPRVPRLFNKTRFLFLPPHLGIDVRRIRCHSRPPITFRRDHNAILEQRRPQPRPSERATEPGGRGGIDAPTFISWNKSRLK